MKLYLVLDSIDMQHRRHTSSSLLRALALYALHEGHADDYQDAERWADYLDNWRSTLAREKLKFDPELGEQWEFPYYSPLSHTVHGHMLYSSEDEAARALHGVGAILEIDTDCTWDFSFSFNEARYIKVEPLPEALRE